MNALQSQHSISKEEEEEEEGEEECGYKRKLNLDIHVTTRVLATQTACKDMLKPPGFPYEMNKPYYLNCFHPLTPSFLRNTGAGALVCYRKGTQFKSKGMTCKTLCNIKTAI